jgi:hypothetical protein
MSKKEKCLKKTYDPNHISKYFKNFNKIFYDL